MTRLATPVGRPVKFNPEQKELAAQLFEEGKSAKQIAKTFNVPPATIYRLGSKGVYENFMTTEGG
ncbi:MAG: helix-turn-helix domain-containing protein [Syntrophobacteraceae bacterium]